MDELTLQLDPLVLGGRVPVLKGTRVSIAMLLHLVINAQYTDGELMEDFGVTEGEIRVLRSLMGSIVNLNRALGNQAQEGDLSVQGG